MGKQAMMQKLVLFVLVGLLSLSGRAQDGDWVPENDQIRAQRAAYITQRLQLSSEEAAHFWQLFNRYEEEKANLKKTFRQERTRPQTEAEADALMKQRFQLEEELLVLKRKFYNEVRAKVPATKLMLLPQAENEFKRDLLRQIRERRGGTNSGKRG